MAEGKIVVSEPEDVVSLTSEGPDHHQGELGVEKRKQWKREQEELKTLLFEEDSPEVLSWRTDKGKFDLLRYVGGVDISFDKDCPSKACAVLAVLSFPALEVSLAALQGTEVVHTTCVPCVMEEPYESGFLAFREVPHLLECLEDLKRSHPECTPQIVLVDGNGVLHTRGFGLASHFGVLAGIPTIGIGKKLHEADGIAVNQQHKQKVKDLETKGSMFDLVGTSGKVLGRAIRTAKDAVNPVFVSVGHNISLDTASELVLLCSRYRIPEPVRQADMLSRQIISKQSHE